MSGQHSEMPSMCEEHVADNRRETFREALEFVLDNQYVEFSNGALEVFKVLIGSGMGLECSGDVSDICFHEMVEVGFVLDEEIRKKFFVEFYGRFRDDILVVLGGDSDTRLAVAREMKRRSRFLF